LEPLVGIEQFGQVGEVGGGEEVEEGLELGGSEVREQLAECEELLLCDCLPLLLSPLLVLLLLLPLFLLLPPPEADTHPFLVGWSHSMQHAGRVEQHHSIMQGSDVERVVGEGIQAETAAIGRGRPGGIEVEDGSQLATVHTDVGVEVN
jgi:hypothetical protein